jgi:hypothetical protein
MITTTKGERNLGFIHVLSIVRTGYLLFYLLYYFVDFNHQINLNYFFVLCSAEITRIMTPLVFERIYCFTFLLMRFDTHYFHIDRCYIDPLHLGLSMARLKLSREHCCI